MYFTLLLSDNLIQLISTFLPCITYLSSGVGFSPFHLVMAFGVKCLQYLAPSGDAEGWCFIYPRTAIFFCSYLTILLYGVVSDVVIEVNMTFTIDVNEKRTVLTVTVSPQ